MDGKKRKNKLKDTADVQVEVALKDRIPADLAKKLRKDKVGDELRRIWSKAKANRQPWLDRMLEYQQDFDEFKHLNDPQGMSGISQIHVPMPITVIKNVHARFVQAIAADLAPVVQPRRSDSVERAPMVKALMGYTLKEWANYNAGVEEELDHFVWDWVSYGDAILKARWHTEYDTYQDVGNFVEAADDIEQVADDGSIIRLPNARVQQEEVRRVVKRFDGPIIEKRPLEDVVIIGHRDPQRASHVFDRYMLNESELNTLADQKLFDAEEVAEVIKSGPDEEDPTSRQIKDQKKYNAGEGGREPELPMYEILEVYFGHDVDESGIHSQVVVWLHPRTGCLLRATYLQRINKSGERPYFKSSYMIRSDSEHGLGLLEMLHPLSIELDFHHNTRVDFGLMSAMPVGFYRASSSLDPKSLKVAPGDLIPLEDPQNDIFYPNLGNRTSFGLQEEASIQTLVERMTGVNDMSLGVMSGAQGPTRTAAGVRGLFAEANANLDVHLRRLNRTWTQTLRFVLHMLQQRLPPGFEFKLLGDDGKLYFPYIRSREDIKGDYDFELSASSATSNPQIMRDRANFIAQVQQNPILLTTGIVTPGNLWEGVRAQLTAAGIKDPHRYITKPADYMYLPTPEEEANRVLRGDNVPVLPMGDHEGFIRYVEFLMTESDPSGAPLIAQFSQEEVVALTRQANAHQQMLASLQQMQAQAANSGQQMRNSLQGLVQANIQLPAGQQ